MGAFEDIGWKEAGGPPASCLVRCARLFSLPDDAAVREWLGQQSGEGWVCCTAEVRPWAGGDLPEGVPLSAEIAARGRPTCWSLRRDGTGWTVWETTESDGTEHRAFDVVWVSTEKGKRLRYRQYWRRAKEGPPLGGTEPIMVWRPFAARFVGWEIT